MLLILELIFEFIMEKYLRGIQISVKFWKIVIYLFL